MPWDLKSDRPIYTQLLEYIKLSIVSGQYKAGDKLPSVRELAAETAVNPNTMQKALSELEREELVFSMRTTGRYITEDVGMINDLKIKLATDQIEEFFKKMKALGLNKEETIKLLEKFSKDDEKEV